MAGAVRVRNFQQLNRTFRNAPKDIQREKNREYRTVAEPVRSTASALALSEIHRMPSSLKWSEMRTGVTQKLVYVAPKKRGIKTRGPDPRRRPNLGTLLMERALEPALARNEHRIAEDFDRMLDRLVDKWGHDGP